MTAEKSWGSTNNKIRIFNDKIVAKDSGVYQIDTGGLSLVMNTEVRPGVVCLIEVKGEILFCINSQFTEQVQAIVEKLNPDLKEYNMIFRPFVHNEIF